MKKLTIVLIVDDSVSQTQAEEVAYEALVKARDFSDAPDVHGVELHDIVQTIEYWWDSKSKYWIIQAKDADDNQVGAAEYAANSRTLPGALANMRAAYPRAEVVKS